MATLTRDISIFIDGSRSGGLEAVLDGKASTQRAYPHALMAGDSCVLNIYFRQRSTANSASTAYELPSGSTLVVAGRTTSGNLLFVSSDFVVSGTSDDVRMAGTLNLNTSEIETAMVGINYGGSIDLYIDIEVRDAGNTERLTYRATAKLYKQIYAGETAPSIVTLPPAILTSPDGSYWQLGVSNDGQPTFTRVL
jgi:hypothetical protein